MKKLNFSGKFVSNHCKVGNSGASRTVGILK